MSQPQRQPDMSMPDDGNNTFVLIEDVDGDAPLRPIDPHQREQLERWRQRRREKLLDERCTIKPETLKKIRIAAERLGIGQGDLLTEGFDLLLQNTAISSAIFSLRRRQATPLSRKTARPPHEPCAVDATAAQNCRGGAFRVQ